MAYAANQRFFHPIYKANVMIVDSPGAGTWNAKIGIGADVSTNAGTGLFTEAELDKLLAEGWLKHTYVIVWPD